jgi:hypothetical protein
VSYEKKLNEDQGEELQFVINHRGMRHVFGIIDDIIEKMRNDVLSVPLSTNPQEAAIQVYGARLKAEGAVALKQAIKAKAEALRYNREGERR